MARRDRLLADATDWLMRHGVQMFSLRTVAKDLNTSARMLSYHFGSKAGLLGAVLMRIAHLWMAEVDTLSAARLTEGLRELWEDRLRAAGAKDLHILTIQLWAQGLASADPAYGAFLATVSRGWVDVLARQFAVQGIGESEAETRAMLCVAAIEGLLLHHITDDTLPSDAAFARLMEVVDGWQA